MAFVLFVLIAISSTALLFLSTPIAVGFVLALIVVALVFFRPFSGLIIYILIVFIIPQNIFMSLIKYRLNLTMAVIVLTIFFTHKLLRRERISFLDTRQQNLMLLLLLAVPLSNLSNMHFRAAWDGVNYFLTVFLLFFIIVNLSDNFRRFQVCCWTIVTCTTLLVINGIIQGLRGIDLVGIPPLEGNRIRYFSHFGDPNDFALLVNTFFPFMLVNIFEKDLRAYRKVLLILIAALYIIALYFTNSRGGYLAFLVMLVYFAFTKWGRLKGTAIGLLFFMTSLVFAPSRMADISPYEGSASGRLTAWAAGLVMLKSRPVIGVGFMNFGLHFDRAAHSAFINCVAELGLVGYFIWIALLYTSFTGLNILDKSPTQTPYKKYARILKISLVGFLVSAFFLSQTYSPILYILLALITITIYNPDSNLKISRGLSARDFMTIAAIIVVSILMFKVLAMIYV
jgi:putative inorganic carbon (HCO3(-)) transporter